MSHQLDWQPGTWGKGVYTTEGRVHTWPVDEEGAPHHAYKHYGPSNCQSLFNIDPDGEVASAGWSKPAPYLEQEHMKTITGADDNLSWQGENPWDFNRWGLEKRREDLEGFKDLTARTHGWYFGSESTRDA